MNRLLFTIAIILFSTSIFGQSLYIGGKYSLNYTSIRNDQLIAQYQTNSIVSFGNNYGLFIDFHVAKKFGIKVDLLFNKHMQKYEGRFLGDTITQNHDFTSETKLSSFDIPIMLVFGNKIYFEIGPVLSFITKAEFVSDYIENFNAKSEFNSANIGLAAGLGVNLKIAKSIHFIAAARYTYGFTDLEGVNAIGSSVESVNQFLNEDYKTFSSRIGIYIGLQFEIFGKK